MKECKTCGYAENPNNARHCLGCGCPFFVDKWRKAEKEAKDLIWGR